MPYLLDDFTSLAGHAATGARWRLFTDRVMGGVSDAQATRVLEGDRPRLLLTGRVSRERNGGFVQVALPLAEPGWFDASRFGAVALECCGDGQPWALHLRTADTRLPWQHYAATFATRGVWERIVVPFADFTPQGLGAPLDRGHLERLGIAGVTEGPVRLLLGRVELMEAA